MKKMSLADLRNAFLKFFEERGHLVKSSYSLIPADDKSLLLVNAGMQPLKDYFTGKKNPPSTKMATCQKCFRTVDIENVGLTSRHATMFEMVGNFSFGDYFKEESLRLGLEFLVDVLGLDIDRIWPTVYLEDDEAYDIWKDKLNIPEERIVRLGKEDNFWEIGVGPCGPCSEIHYDMGEHLSCGSKACAPGCDCDRYVEVWNHVFSQFEKTEDGSYIPLKNKNIDTGMGLERIACIVQGVDSIFEIDAVKYILDKVLEYSGQPSEVSPKIVTDHFKSVVFLISDGVAPSNEGRGYVLRRVFRRAVRHADKLGIAREDFISIADAVSHSYGQAYPDIQTRMDYIKKVIESEYDRFHTTLDKGMGILQQYISQLPKGGKLDGDKAFTLYDTYGFPIELTKELLEENGMGCDEEGFALLMEKQRETARAASSDEGWESDETGSVDASEFLGYDLLENQSEITFYQDGEIALAATPFYPEGGGQVGDRGMIEAVDGAFSAEIVDAKKSPSGTILHKLGKVRGEIKLGAKVMARVDRDLRMATMRNHTATHLLHKALRVVLGEHVVQAGSLVSEDRLRFDFSHFESMTKEQLLETENMVNDMIFNPVKVEANYMPLEEAKAAGAMALFGEKYSDIARVVTMSDYSVELCGGTHLDSTSEVGIFKIISESGIAAGVRRIEAQTGMGVLKILRKKDQILSSATEILKTSEGELGAKVQALSNNIRHLQKENEGLMAKLASSSLETIEQTAVQVGNIQFISADLKGLDQKALRTLGDSLVERNSSLCLVLASKADEKINVIVMAGTDAVLEGVNSGNIAKIVATEIGGGGGGRPNMAQASGRDYSGLNRAFQMALESLKAI